MPTTGRGRETLEVVTSSAFLPNRRELLRLAGGATVAVLVAGCRDPHLVESTGKVPAPLSMVRTSWSADQWALGSYSFLPVGAEPSMRRSLAEPLDGRVFFAGEATSLSAPATVHGALESGDRAAAEVVAAATPGETVAVIGAGAAGLRAAATLRDRGFTVVVLEARDRIGGRIATVRPNGWPIPIELGASWVHDIVASDLADQLAALGVATTPFDYDDARDVFIEGLNADALDGVIADIERALTAAEEAEADQSISDAVVAVGGELDLAFDHVDEVELAAEYGANADELSAWWGTQEGSQGDDLLVLGGYGRLTEHLATGLDVRTESAVETVRWSFAEVSLDLADGTVISVDRVVVTVPLAVLASGRLQFEPPLPTSTQTALTTIGTGLLDKVWFRFAEPFWETDALVWSRVTPPGEAFRSWFNLLPLTGEPVLLALHGGRTARMWASRSDDDFRSAAMKALEQFAAAGF